MREAFRRPASDLWPNEGLSRIPYGLYNAPEIYQREQAKLFRGPVWNFVALDCELTNPGDYKTTWVGELPVIVVRTKSGAVAVFENRCAHRGATLCLERFGKVRNFTCIYHGWSFNLGGELVGVPFQKGIKGDGGMPADFRREDHGLKQLNTAVFAGLIFASLQADTASIEQYLGLEIGERIKRVMGKPVKVLGYHTQILRNNWKLYAENVRDSYHASILHLFFTTFKVNRLNQTGGIIVSESGGHHVSYSKADSAGRSADYDAAKLRADKQDFGLKEPGLLQGPDEFGDGISLQILSVFPNLVLQQIANSLVVRQILPKGVDRAEVIWTYYGYRDDSADLTEHRLIQANLVGPAGFISMEDGAVGSFIQRALAGTQGDTSVVMMGGREAASQTSRASETSVRGFWKMYRNVMDI